jgi:RNA polymerase-binding transcription factor DksA
VKKAAPVKKAPVKKAMPPAPPKKKAKPEPKRLTASPFDTTFLEAQRAELLRQRARYTEHAESLKAEADALAAEREPGDVQFDDESGEGDTLAVQRDFDLAASAQARDAVDQIDHALAKIDGGTYGICEVSGQAIPKARLEAIPWARERVEYKVGDFGRR